MLAAHGLTRCPIYWGWFLLLLAVECTRSTTLDPIQQDNIQLIRQLQAALNRRQWAVVTRLYAGQVRYKSPATNYQEVMLTPTQVMAAYVGGPLEIIQLYPAYQHQVVVEGRLRERVPQSICLIYTIEQGHITRQYIY